MKRITFDELRAKEVINLCDGRRLGFICDAEIDPECGRICAVFVPSEPGLFFTRCERLRIGWDKIEKIGDDIILVRSEETRTEKG